MGKRCIVPYCRTRYAKKEKVSIFRVPNDKVKQWQRAMYGIKLTCNDRVCAKHFSEQHIIRTIKTNVYSYELKIPRLTPDAVPSIFPEAFEKSFKDKKIDNNYIEEHSTLNETTDDPEEANIEDESPSSSNSIDDLEDSIIDNSIIIKDEEENAANDSDDCILINESSDDEDHSNDCTNSNNSDCENIFQQCILSYVTQQATTESNWLYDLSMGKISLPDTSWAIHSITNGNDPLALPSICITKMIIENDKPITKFNIVITNNIIKYFIFNKQIHKMNVENINNLRTFERLIYRICYIECCYGVEEPLIPANFKNPFYKIDPLLNRWRHIYCNYIIDDKRYQICSNCKKIFLAVYESGRKSNSVNGNELLNVRKKMLVMQKRMRIRNQNLVNEMIDCKRKIGQISNNNESIYIESSDNLKT